MLGWAQEELLGRPMHETVHFQRADGTAIAAEDCGLLDVRQHAAHVQILDDAFTRRDGSIMPIAYSSAPLRSGPTVQGVVVVFRDTTEEKKEREDAAQRELARSAGWDAYAMPSTRVGSCCIPNPSRRSGLARAMRNSCSGWWAVTVRSSCPGRSSRWRALRPHRRDRPLGDRPGSPARRRPDAHDRDKSVRSLNRNLGSAPVHRAATARDRSRSGEARLRDHRDGAHARHRSRRDVRPRIGRDRLRDSPRRLRHRLSELHLSQAAHHLPQDRPRLRPRHGEQPFESPRGPGHRHLAKGFGLKTIAEGSRTRRP